MASLCSLTNLKYKRVESEICDDGSAKFNDFETVLCSIWSHALRGIPLLLLEHGVILYQGFVGQIWVLTQQLAYFYNSSIMSTSFTYAYSRKIILLLCQRLRLCVSRGISKQSCPVLWKAIIWGTLLSRVVHLFHFVSCPAKQPCFRSAVIMSIKNSLVKMYARYFCRSDSLDPC